MKDSSFCRKGTENYAVVKKKFQPLSYPNLSKSELYFFSLFREKYYYFLRYLGYFCQETGRGHKWKRQNQNLTYPILPTRFLVNFLLKKIVSHTFHFYSYKSQRTFQKHFNPDFQVLPLFLVSHQHIWNNKLEILMQNLMLNPLAPISNPKNE